MAKTGWIVLLVSEAFSLFLSLMLLVSPFTIMEDPEFRLGQGLVLLRLWGGTWLALTAVALAILFTSFRRGERWAWYALWVLPLLWLSHFALAPDLIHNLVLAIVTAAALGMTYRTFFRSA